MLSVFTGSVQFIINAFIILLFNLVKFSNIYQALN